MSHHDAVDPAQGSVLVTDGEFKHTLGIVRALAAHGHEVHVVAQSTRAPAVHSRAVCAWHRAPPPGDPGYDARLLEIASALEPVSLIPVGSGSVAAADRMRERLAPRVRLALAPSASIGIACDKVRTGELARALGVPTPRETVVLDLGAARAAWRDFGTPLVLKSWREEGRKVVRYVGAEADLEDAFEAVRRLSCGRALAQQYVEGDGFGFSALYWNGERQRFFMHRRVREWPPSGGTSACAESVREFPELERAGTALLDALRWHGVAMVEFKGSRARGTLALMEINAKFWGSHDVALAAGVNFPVDLVALLEGRGLPPQEPYRDVRFSWPLGGDLWHGFYRPSSLPRVIWDWMSPRVAHSFRWSDPAPSVREWLQWLRSAPGAWREFRDLRR